MTKWSTIRQSVRLEKYGLWPLIATVVAGAAFGALELEKGSPAVNPAAISGKVHHPCPEPAERSAQ
jgi:hypothetical protein